MLPFWLNANGCAKTNNRTKRIENEPRGIKETHREKITAAVLVLLQRAPTLFNNFKYHAVPIILIYLYCCCYLCVCRIYLVAAPCFVLCDVFFCSTNTIATVVVAVVVWFRNALACKCKHFNDSYTHSLTPTEHTQLRHLQSFHSMFVWVFA